MSYAWRTSVVSGHGQRSTVVTRWEGSRIWAGIPTDSPTAAQLAVAIGTAMYRWSTREIRCLVCDRRLVGEVLIRNGTYAFHPECAP